MSFCSRSRVGTEELRDMNGKMASERKEGLMRERERGGRERLAIQPAAKSVGFAWEEGLRLHASKASVDSSQEVGAGSKI